ncbi:MAG TPA: cohesin domain-containing protein [Candidatus Polarisedimenticolaceae bacterium]|nr:cohesin domain-containing protein [Candidatus Polarisedimenticolaceae bacterium]
MRNGRNALLLLVAAAAMIGCGGGSGGDGDAVGGPGTTVSADFVADQPSPPASTVSLQKAATSSNLVTVRVDATGVSGIYGAAFDLAFDANLAEYVGFTHGSFFEQGATTEPNYTVNSPGPGQLVVAVSRTGNVPGVSTTASRTIVNLTFRVKVAGSGQVTVPDAALLDAQLQPQPVPGITWEAGTLRGN